MAMMTWNDKYSVSINEMDNQHKELINLLNELYDAMSSGKSNTLLSSVITKLIAYTRKHFAAEELFMQKYAYPSYEAHKREHAAFIMKVQEFQQNFNAGKITLSIDISTFLKNWLVNHIQVEDKKYGTFAASKGAK